MVRANADGGATGGAAFLLSRFLPAVTLRIVVESVKLTELQSNVGKIRRFGKSIDLTV